MRTLRSRISASRELISASADEIQYPACVRVCVSRKMSSKSTYVKQQEQETDRQTDRDTDRDTERVRGGILELENFILQSM